MAPSTVLLVSSGHFFWLGLNAMLGEVREVRVLGLVREQEAAAIVRAAEAGQPAFIVVAADLPGVPLVALLEALQARCPAARLIVIGQALEYEEEQWLLTSTVACHVRWEVVSAERMRHIFALVSEGAMWVASAAITAQLVPPDRRRRQRAPGIVLTEREREVMAGLAAGLMREEIAARTHLGSETVKRTIAALRAKFDAPTTFVLGMKAAWHGFSPIVPATPTGRAR